MNYRGLKTQIMSVYCIPRVGEKVCEYALDVDCKKILMSFGKPVLIAKPVIYNIVRNGVQKIVRFIVKIVCAIGEKINRVFAINVAPLLSEKALKENIVQQNVNYWIVSQKKEMAVGNGMESFVLVAMHAQQIMRLIKENMHTELVIEYLKEIYLKNFMYAMHAIIENAFLQIIYLLEQLKKTCWMQKIKDDWNTSNFWRRRAKKMEMLSLMKIKLEQLEKTLQQVCDVQ